MLSLDNPPVNALSLALREGLLGALNRSAADSRARAIVLISAGRDFSVGGDVKEMGGPRAAMGPRLRDLNAAMVRAGKPVVAAISGYALGGGLELALCCHARIAAADAVLGLPEVTLGLLPGGGGTVRLPRIVGAEAALEIMLEARRLSSSEALGLRLVDEVSDDLRTAALETALRLAAGGQTVPPRRTPPQSPSAIATARARMDREAPGRVAPQRIIDCVEASGHLTLSAALEYEAQAYAELAFGDGDGARQHRERIAKFLAARRPASG